MCDHGQFLAGAYYCQRWGVEGQRKGPAWVGDGDYLWYGTLDAPFAATFVGHLCNGLAFGSFAAIFVDAALDFFRC